MSELYFRLGEMRGFTAIDLADKKESYTNPIRELMQNALDASHEADNNTCNIDIFIETIPVCEIPHIKEYKEVLKNAIKTAESQGSYNENSKQRVAPINEALKKSELNVLLFADNGVGMKQYQLEAMLTGGVSIKGNDEKSGGSFGVGNLSSYSLSSLRYVLYATKYRDEGTIKTLFTGSPILAGYKDEVDDKVQQRGNRGRIVIKEPENEENPEFAYPEKFPKFIRPKIDKLDTGTVVAILGLSEGWSDDAEYAIVSNFFHAIAHEGLIITIHQGGSQMEISDDKAELLIDSRKDNKRAMGENILSGKMVFQAWQAIHEENSQKTITLSNSDKVYVFIKSDKNANSGIVLVRNGMVVARHDSMLSKDMDELRKNPDFESFTAIIDIDGQEAPKLFKLMKNAEGPYHNKLQKGVLIGKEEGNLKKLLKELSGKMKEHLKKIERDSVDLPLFTVPSKAEEKASGVNKPDEQDEDASPRPIDVKPPKKDPPNPTKEGNGCPPPTVISRHLKSKTAVRCTDKVDKWEVRLRITPTNKGNAKDDAYLSIGLGEENDNEKQPTYLDFITAELNGRKIEPSEGDARQINLGSLNQETQYNVTAEIKKPDHIGDMKVALQAILRLKRHKKSKG